MYHAQPEDIVGQLDQEATTKEDVHQDMSAKDHHGLNIHTMQELLILSSKFSHLTMVSLTLAIIPTQILLRIKSVSPQPIKTRKALLLVRFAQKDSFAQLMELELLHLLAPVERYAPNHQQLQLMDHAKRINFVKMVL